MERWIDTHVHYDARQYTDLNILLPEVFKEVKTIINCGTKTKTIKSTMNLCEKFDNVYGVIGYFPCDTLELERNPKLLDDLKNQLQHTKAVGIGEIGLDYYWDSVGYGKDQIKGKKAREIQKKWFIKQIELANELQLPICVHSRDAEKDTIEILKQNPPKYGCVIHCYAYGMSCAKEFVNMGFYFGIGGTSTYKNNEQLREVIKMLPMEQIVLETDGPYLTPEPNRRQRNDSRQIKYVIDNISKIKDISTDDVIKITNTNVKNIYKGVL